MEDNAILLSVESDSKAVADSIILVENTSSPQDHIELMERAHGTPRDHMLRRFLQNNDINENTPADKLYAVITYYYENETELLNDFDVYRHMALVEGVSQARAQRRAEWGQALTGMLSVGAQVVDVYQQQAKAEREAKQAQAERNRQQRIQERAEANQQAQDAARQYVQGANRSYANSGNSRQVGSKSDLYTSDPSWNKTIDLMVQQQGLEKTAQMVQQMRANKAQSSQTSQSSYSPTAGTGNPDGTLLTAVTVNRTLIYINVKGGSITHYATGKDGLGKYNWRYIGSASITTINMTPYEAQFGKEYSRAANISGVGYVFFN